MDAPDTIHHVTVRTVNRLRLFRDDADYSAYVLFLGLTCERYGLSCIAYCLMPNQVHVVMHSTDGRLSAAMQYLAAAYARRHHHRYRSNGHLFQGRYDSMLVKRDPYLLEVVRYVLLNPVRARLCRAAADWRWSTARDALGLRVAPRWANFQIVNELLGPADGFHNKRLERLLSAGRPMPTMSGGVSP